jgi:2'-5' RNA ligase
LADTVSSLAVVAYPTLSDDDRQWIEGVRVRHDPLASRIAAHVTLVFPTEVREAPVVAHVRSALQFCESIPVVLRGAVAFPDRVGSGYYVFLLAEEGYAELLAVHDALYNGVLADHRRRDIPFVPHVTVGAHPQLGECERIANQLNEERRIVRAQINNVDVIEVDESMVRTVAEIPLGSGGKQPPNPTVQRTGRSPCSPSGR